MDISICRKGDSVSFFTDKWVSKEEGVEENKHKHHIGILVKHGFHAC